MTDMTHTVYQYVCLEVPFYTNFTLFSNNNLSSPGVGKHTQRAI